MKILTTKSAAVLFSYTFLVACRASDPQVVEPPAGERPNAAAPVRAASAATPRLVFLGDSLTSGFGLSTPTRAFPALLQARLEREGRRFEVVNAGVSGDTTAGGLRRLEWALEGDVRIVVIALGANDGLRGLAPAEMKRNLGSLVERAARRGASVVLAGMEAPPNLGPEYTAQFRNVYRDVAREQHVPLLPFLLQGVAGDPSLNQADGIHPNEGGAERIANLLWPVLEPVLTQRAAR